MSKNYGVNRSFLNFIHARNFFPEEDAENCRLTVKDLINYDPNPYGRQIPEFNLIFPDSDVLFGGMLGDFVKLDEERSGTFRKPYHNLIHFEDFEYLTEWRLAVALEDTTFTTYSHVSGAKTAIDGYEFDYHNEEDWLIESMISLRQNDAVFYRPWVFHSFEEKLILCYVMKGEQ